MLWKVIPKFWGADQKKQDHRKIFNLNLGVIEMMISELG